MATANARFLEDAGISFAIYCDEHGLTRSEGLELAERVYDELEMVASDRGEDDE